MNDGNEIKELLKDNRLLAKDLTTALGKTTGYTSNLFRQEKFTLKTIEKLSLAFKKLGIDYKPIVETKKESDSYVDIIKEMRVNNSFLREELERYKSREDYYLNQLNGGLFVGKTKVSSNTPRSTKMVKFVANH
jgi:hypothetical protein